MTRKHKFDILNITLLAFVFANIFSIILFFFLKDIVKISNLYLMILVLASIISIILTPLLATKVMISHEKLILEKDNLEYTSQYDDLTKIYNRGYFNKLANDHIKQSFRYENDLSIILIDYDNFKYINDTYGHNIGDEVLIITTAIIKQSIRDTDIFARYGGDEFIILSSFTNKDEILILANKIVNNIQRTEIIDGISIKLSASLGCAQYDKSIDKKDISSLIKRADLALYKVKNEGRNSFAFQSI